MTKTISLSDDAYEASRSLKEPGESFSGVARRLAAEVKQRRMMAAIGAWKDMDTERIKSDIYRWREESMEPRH